MMDEKCRWCWPEQNSLSCLELESSWPERDYMWVCVDICNLNFKLVSSEPLSKSSLFNAKAITKIYLTEIPSSSFPIHLNREELQIYYHPPHKHTHTHTHNCDFVLTLKLFASKSNILRAWTETQCEVCGMRWGGSTDNAMMMMAAHLQNAWNISITLCAIRVLFENRSPNYGNWEISIKFIGLPIAMMRGEEWRVDRWVKCANCKKSLANNNGHLCSTLFLQKKISNKTPTGWTTFW